MKSPNYALLLILAILSVHNSFSQIRFEKGYYLDNEGKKTDCLIRNVDWAYNPGFFEYKIDARASVSRKAPGDVKEFVIEKKIKFVSAKIMIDRSSDVLNDNEISNSVEPEWKEEQLFLKVIEEGDVTLFSYEEHDFLRFFYQVKGSPIDQLIYKRYKKPGKITHEYNRNYLNQLFIHVNCKHVAIERLENVSYSTSSLTKWFRKQNECLNPNNPGTSWAKKKKWFFPKLLAGINAVSYRSGNSTNSSISNIDFGTKIGLTVGAELEGYLDLNNKKWSAVLGASSLSYKSSATNNAGARLSAEYNTINIWLGLRFHSYLTDKVRLFATGGVVKDFKQPKIGPAIGAGIAIGHFSTEAMWYFQKKILTGYLDPTTGSQFKHMALTVKYSLF